MTTSTIAILPAIDDSGQLQSGRSTWRRFFATATSFGRRPHIGRARTNPSFSRGEAIDQVRYVLNWRDPRSGGRHQQFFSRMKDAQEARAELIVAYERGAYAPQHKGVTVNDAVAGWLENKRGVVRPITFATYQFQVRYVQRPLPPAEDRCATIRSGTGAKPKSRSIELLGNVKLHELCTRQVRAGIEHYQMSSLFIRLTRRLRSSKLRWRWPLRTSSFGRLLCRAGSSAGQSERTSPF
jgi:hypothetical protein